MSIFNSIPDKPYFETNLGEAYLADTIEFIKKIPEESIDLIMTSPPFALVRKKSYGNEDEKEYINWFINNFAFEFRRILKPNGSLVIDIGGAYKPKRPVRSLEKPVTCKGCLSIIFPSDPPFFSRRFPLLCMLPSH